jgi:bifunctional DNA-binding transcriptional regulator/antitoxin component of YhaV-PrlF toxin-antitoxin module
MPIRQCNSMSAVGKKSTVTKATTTSTSLRATIPEEIVKELEILAGDVLDWEIMSDKGRKAVRVRKLE